MAQIAIPAIKWGKRKQRSQMCEIFTEDGRIVTVELEVLLGCADDPNTGWGFIIDAENQLVAEDGNWTQILGERSSLPICMVNDTKVKDLNTLINSIFHESSERAKMEQYLNAAKNVVWDRITWIVAIGCGTTLLLFGIKWLGG